MFRSICPLGLAFAISAVASAATIHVPAQHPTIQGAITAAVNGDTILVAPGTYAEKIVYNGKRIEIRSTGGPEATIINAAGQNDSAVTFKNAELADSILDGFTIRGGIGFQTATGRVGGGIRCDVADPTIRNCIIKENTAARGGGIHCTFADPTLINNLIFSNTTTSFGGGLYVTSSNPSLTNCTIADNSATAGGGLYHNSSSPLLLNCIVYFNSPNSFNGSGLQNPIVRYSNIEGGYSGTMNFNSNPAFVSLAGENFRLNPGSPCIDRSDSTSVAEIAFTDLDGNMRGVNDPSVFDFGVPVFGLVVDAGAYERQIAGGPTTCPGDIDSDNDVDFDDFVNLLANWGDCP